MNRDIEKYAKAYTDDLNFESTLVKYRQHNVLSQITISSHSNVLEIGIGDSPLVNIVTKKGVQFKGWTIVEPANQFLAKVSDMTYPNIHLINDFFPCDVGNQTFDIIICSGLLHEVVQPALILDAVHDLLAPDGVFIADVPNAWSLHRQIAFQMNIIDSVYQKSDRKIALQQNHLFDKASLHLLVQQSGLDVVEEGGYFIKPLDHE